MGVLDEQDFDDVVRLQRQLSSSMMNEFELDGKIKILSLFDEIVGSGPKKKIQTAKLLLEAEHRGMSEFEVMGLIDKLKKDGMFFEPQPGYLQKG